MNYSEEKRMQQCATNLGELKEKKRGGLERESERERDTERKTKAIVITAVGLINLVTYRNRTVII